MISEHDFTAPPGVAEALKAAAICHTCHPGVAATALLRAAADILCASFGPEQTSEIIVAVVTEAMALQMGATSPAGHA